MNVIKTSTVIREGIRRDQGVKEWSHRRFHVRLIYGGMNVQKLPGDGIRVISGLR